MVDENSGKPERTIHIIRMAPSEDYGLEPEMDYLNFYWRTNALFHTPYRETLQEEQIQWTGAWLAKWGMENTLAIGNVRIYDPTFETHHNLCCITNRQDTWELKQYFEEYAPNAGLQWTRHPGFESETVIAWLMPAKYPAIIFKPTVRSSRDITKCENYEYCMMFIEAYGMAIKEDGFRPEELEHPFF